MKATKTLTVMFALFLIGSIASADDSTKTWLKGLGKVKVSISVANDLVAAGVPGAQLRTQTELQLRQAGLQVDQTLDKPTLYIELTGVRGPGTNNYACYVLLSVSENVKMERNDAAISTLVWGPDLQVLYLVNHIPETLLNSTKERVDTFLNDWLQANPR